MGVISKIISYIYEGRWEIELSQTPLEEIVKGKELKTVVLKHNYHDRWFADPFVLEVSTDIIDLLVEEYLYSTGLGRISRLTIDRKNCNLISNKPVLELHNHLSFPAILRKGEELFIYPENSASGGLDLYKFNQSNDSCEKIGRICEEPLTDAIITCLFGKEALFSTKTPTQNGNSITEYRKVDNHYKPYKTYFFKSNIARNAGDWFKICDEVYRPAQDCNECYGAGVIIQKVETDSDENIIFSDVRRVESDNKDYNIGCHTFNHYKGVTVIDVHGYKRPNLVRIADFMRIQDIINSVYLMIKRG